jgi:hypothetical protein
MPEKYLIVDMPMGDGLAAKLRELQSQCVEITPEQGKAPLVGTGSWFSCGAESAELFCREMESLAERMFDEGRERDADSLNHAAEIIRRHAARATVRQPQENQ